MLLFVYYHYFWLSIMFKNLTILLLNNKAMNSLKSISNFFFKINFKIYIFIICIIELIINLREFPLAEDSFFLFIYSNNLMIVGSALY